MKKNHEEFEDLAKPLAKFLAENYHPHVTAVISAEEAKLEETLCGFPQEKVTCTGCKAIHYKRITLKYCPYCGENLS